MAELQTYVERILIAQSSPFQLENSPIYSAIMEWFISNHVHVLDGSNQSPDLKLIDNL